MTREAQHKRLGVAVAGLGVGESHARCVHAGPASFLAGIYDPNREKAERLAAELGTGCADSFDALLSDERVDAVVIASPDHEHTRQVIRALSAGKHVFCEKPLCNTLEELHGIAEAWRAHGGRIKLDSNLVLRSAPLYLWLKKVISDGLLGDVFAFDGDYLYGRLWKIIDGWRGSGENYSGMKGGGVHLIDLMCWLTGQRPSRVTTYGNNFCTRDADITCTDFMSAMFRFESGLVGRVTANLGCVHRHQHVLRIFGTRGTFLFDDTGPRLHLSSDPALRASAVDLPTLPEGKSGLIPAFLEAVRNDQDLSRNTQNVFDAVSICVSCDRSLKTGQEETVVYV